jgi:hypothetical protein
VPASATKHGFFLLKGRFRPALCRVVGQFFVTLVTGIILSTARKLDGDDIAFGVPVLATPQSIGCFSFDYKHFL